jgi:O-antigen/teichoic acid export membrane protein
VTGLRETTIRGVAWSLYGRVGTQVLQYGVSILMARLLSPSDFGRVGMVTVLTLFASVFVDFGIGAAVLERRDLSDEETDAAFSLTLAVGVAMTAIIVSLAPLVAMFYRNPALASLARVSALGFTLSSFGIVPRALLQRKLEVKRLAIIDFTGAGIGCLVGAALTLAGAGVWAIVFMPLAGSGSVAALAFIRSGWRPTRLFQFGAAKPLLRVSVHLLLFNIINYWARSLDNLLVGKRLGERELGYYARAYSVMLLPLSQITGVLGAGVLPAMAHAAVDKARVLRGYLDAMKMIAFVCLPTMTGLTLFAGPFVRTIYGEQWVPVIPILRVLAMLGFLQSLSSPTGWIYVSQGRTDRMARWGFGACSTLILAIIIGAWMGSALKVAWAYLIANVILVPIGIAYAGELIGLTLPALFRAIIPSIVATLGMALVVAGIVLALPSDWRPGFRLAIPVLAGVITYTALSHLLRNPAWAEMRTFMKARLGGLRARVG